jgi:polysaccharide biosynthesis/export protein
MKKQFIFISICLAFIITFTASSVYAGEQKPSTVDTKSGSNYYRIGSGDILDINTWKENDFSRTGILVRIDGKISFPLLNDIQAGGQTPLQLKKKIEIKLKNFIDNPVVTVTVTSPDSKKVYILGEVVNTGEYPLVKSLTVLQAFALAGGFTQWASKKEIILFRKEDGKDKTIIINYKNILKGKDFKQNVQLQADDTIIVP